MAEKHKNPDTAAAADADTAADADKTADGPTKADDPPTLFGTSGIRGPIGETVTAGTALAVGRAVASAGAESVVLGRDARTTGGLLADTVAAGVRECGTDVVDLGAVSTPTVARFVAVTNADAGIVVTASHNPPQDNGIKLWESDGRAFGTERRRRIERIIHEEDFEFASWEEVGQRSQRRQAALDHHRERLVSVASDRGDGVADCTVVVDVGNGMGGITARALHEAGCQVQTLNGEPDGRFPGRASEPTPETCTALRMLVAGTDADFGIAHDGDADRMLAVDENGRFVPGDQLLALFATDAAEDGDTVAAPLNTSLAVERALADVGAELSRTRVGDVHVARRAVEDGAAFAGEPSGSWIWPDETTFPDGPLAACKLAAFAGERGSIADAVDALPRSTITRDIVSLETEDQADDADRIIGAATSTARQRFDSVSTLDGLRVTTDEGWFLVRASGTQPLIRLTAEGETDDQSEMLLDRARTTVMGAIDEAAPEVQRE